jgi:hypothetical protein
VQASALVFIHHRCVRRLEQNGVEFPAVDPSTERFIMLIDEVLYFEFRIMMRQDIVASKAWILMTGGRLNNELGATLKSFKHGRKTRNLFKSILFILFRCNHFAISKRKENKNMLN